MQRNSPAQQGLPGVCQKPVATVMPLAKTYESDRRNSADATRQALRSQQHISRRARERLETAEARHRHILSGLELDCDKQGRQLYAETLAEEAEKDRLDAVATACLAQAEAEVRAKELSEASAVDERQHAMDRAARIRIEAAERTKVVEARIRGAQESADQSVLSSRANTCVQLDELSRMRKAASAKSASEVAAQDAEKEGILQSCDAQSHLEVVRSEVARQQAAMVVDLADTRAQEMTREAKDRTQRDEAMAADCVSQLTKAGYIMEGQLECVLKDKLRDSALNLESAHDYCQEVRRTVANENAHFQRQMRQIELDAAARARSEERKVIALEAERLNEFAQAHDALSQTESLLLSRRADCEAEAAELHQRLRQAEEDSRQRADQILGQWTASSEAAEQAVRQFERQGRKIMESMQSNVNDKIKAFLDQNAAVQEKGTAKIVELECEANKVIDTTQPTLDAAKRDDESEAAAADVKRREARHLPEDISKKADADIEAKETRSRQIEAELEQQAKVQIAVARAAAKAAHEEEQRLQVETAEAWSRIRKACLELRLANLHDFAQDIVSGDYDAQMFEHPTAMAT